MLRKRINMRNQFYIFIIKDASDEVWGIAPTKIEAKKQAQWFLPKENQYYIEPTFINMERIKS